jgi:hypothetical protein
VGHTQEMIDTFPHEIGIDVPRLAEAIDVLIDCANTCTLCADACLAEPEISELARCIRLNLDCADVCLATSRVVSRVSDYDLAVMRPLLEACRAACERCRDECERHAEHMEHCRVCAEQCMRCERACDDLLQSMHR